MTWYLIVLVIGPALPRGRLFSYWIWGKIGTKKTAGNPAVYMMNPIDYINKQLFPMRENYLPPIGI
jgi:hypothetical protein